MNDDRRMVSWRITALGRRLLKAIAKANGTSQSAVLEQAIRREATERKIK
jgi:hypothetical protein